METEESTDIVALSCVLLFILGCLFFAGKDMLYVLEHITFNVMDQENISVEVILVCIRGALLALAGLFAIGRANYILAEDGDQ